MTTFSSVDCSEEHGTANENRTIEEWTASVVLRCTFANRHALVQDLLGNRRTWPYGGSIAGLFCVSAGITFDPSAYSQNVQGVDYDSDALVAVNYSSNAEATLFSESLEPTADFLTLDHKKFKWSISGDLLEKGEEPSKLYRGLNLNRTLYEVITIPPEVLTGVGSVHNATYTSSILGLPFAPETLLYIPPSLNRTITTAGTKGWTVALKFSYKPQTWNKYWRAQSNAFEEIADVETGVVYKGYTPQNLSALLP